MKHNLAMKSDDANLHSLKSERDRFVAFAFASADILLELDEAGVIRYADGATIGLLGTPSEELVGARFDDWLDGGIKLAEEIKDTDRAGRLENISVKLKSRHNGAMPFALSGFKLPSLDNHSFITLSLLRNNLSPEELARRDLESGLLKKESFADIATQKIREASDNGHDVRITLLDLPALKAFLDNLPPDQAHGLMSEISAYLRSKSLGGDMAGIIGENAYSFVHDASLTHEQVVKEIVEITRKADPSGQGVTMEAQTIEPAAPQLTAQDSASALLYTINKFANKAGGEFSIHSLSEGYQAMLDETVTKIGEFKHTVADDAYQIAFQPIVDLKSGIIHHFETLVRLDDSDTFKNPFQFITFGEEAGIIGDFDLAMCQKTLTVLERAAKEGNKPLVSVNLSGKSLSSNLFMDTLDRIMRNHQPIRKQVIFEVTESSKINDLKTANDFIQLMRREGNMCCLDDFGVGESSFDYLRNLQVDFVKIDGSYVRESISTPRGKHLLKAMAGLCRDLDIVTIGEMVEDEKAAAILWEAGVRFGQGYLFGKPNVDEKELIHCSRPNPYYNGIMRAKRVGGKKRAWWARNDG